MNLGQHTDPVVYATEVVSWLMIWAAVGYAIRKAAERRRDDNESSR